MSARSASRLAAKFGQICPRSTRSFLQPKFPKPLVVKALLAVPLLCYFRASLGIFTKGLVGIMHCGQLAQTNGKPKNLTFE
ncbi:MAG: hypothetical protein ACI9DC_002640 [Gammaproteobacteria bacterium]|jgi:hypothetical protein